MTINAFVIGHPIRHSRSPLIHGDWLARYGIDGSYRAIDVAPAALPAFFQRVRAGEFAGGNVTIPHKQAVLALCDLVDPLAASIGAVNTVVARDGRIEGSNSDYLGFLGNLDAARPGWSHAFDTAIVLGAGGAARAILVALRARGLKTVHVLNRTVATAKALADEIDGPFLPGALDDFNTLAPAADLLVNTTSIGLNGSQFDNLALRALPKTALVTDVVYVPLQTPLLRDAQALGLHTVDGLGMLLHQAVPGFAAWFGVTPEVTPALRARIVASLEH